MVYALVNGDRRIGTRLRMTILQTHMKIGKKKLKEETRFR